MRKRRHLFMQTIQQCQVHYIFEFYLLYCNPREKDHIRRKLGSKKKNISIYISILIILICQKLELVELVQQKIKLLLPNNSSHEAEELEKFEGFPLN